MDYERFNSKFIGDADDSFLYDYERDLHDALVAKYGYTEEDATGIVDRGNFVIYEHPDMDDNYAEYGKESFSDFGFDISSDSVSASHALEDSIDWAAFGRNLADRHAGDDIIEGNEYLFRVFDRTM